MQGLLKGGTQMKDTISTKMILGVILVFFGLFIYTCWGFQSEVQDLWDAIHDLDNNDGFWECIETKTEQKYKVIEAETICSEVFNKKCIGGEEDTYKFCIYDESDRVKYNDCMKTQKAELQFYNETTCIKEHLVRDVR